MSENLPKVVPFQFDNFAVRTVMIEDEPWFVAADVCAALNISNSRDAMTRLDDDEKADVALTDTSSNGVIQKRNINIINESGLYSLVLRSDKPEAKRFKKWITSEVLPSIRKTGTYSANHPQPETYTPRLPVFKQEFEAAFSICQLLGLDKNQSALSANKATIRLTGVNILNLIGHEQLVSEVQELAFTPTELGKRVDVSGQKFNRLLQDAGLQNKVNDSWIPTETGKPFALIIDTDKKHKSGAPVLQVKWREGVLDKLRA